MELDEIDSLKIFPQALRKVVALTGAGISAESGVPTFRGPGGLWKQFRAEDLATPQAFKNDPKLVWEWYIYRRQIIAKSNPNPGHIAIVELQQIIMDNFLLITQNVDGLHRRAGSKDLIELHGNIFLNRCNQCSRRFPDDVLNFEVLPPLCPNCQGEIRPDVVWFGENLDPVSIEDAFAASRRASLFLSIGTSAIVHPAASLPLIAKENGAMLIEINPERTPLTPLADCALPYPSAIALPPLKDKIQKLRAAQA